MGRYRLLLLPLRLESSVGGKVCVPSSSFVASDARGFCSGFRGAPTSPSPVVSVVCENISALSVQQSCRSCQCWAWERALSVESAVWPMRGGLNRFALRIKPRTLAWPQRPAAATLSPFLFSSSLLPMNSLISKPILRSSRLLVQSQRAFATGALRARPPSSSPSALFARG